MAVEKNILTMKDETLERLLNYIEDNEYSLINGKRKKRTQHLVDRKSYIIFLLIIKFNYSNERIADLFKIHRTSCYDVLRKIEFYLKDLNFKSNISDLLDIYHYTSDDINKLNEKINSKRRYERKIIPEVINNVFHLSENDIEKLKKNKNVVNIIKLILKEI